MDIKSVHEAMMLYEEDMLLGRRCGEIVDFVQDLDIYELRTVRILVEGRLRELKGKE